MRFVAALLVLVSISVHAESLLHCSELDAPDTGEMSFSRDLSFVRVERSEWDEKFKKATAHAVDRGRVYFHSQADRRKEMYWLSLGYQAENGELYEVRDAAGNPPGCMLGLGERAPSAEFTIERRGGGFPPFGRVQYTCVIYGRSRNTDESTLLFELGPKPRVIGELSCVPHSGVGRWWGSTWYDSLACDWSSVERDIVCRGRQVYTFPWSSRDYDRRFRLSDGESLPPTGVALPFYRDVSAIKRSHSPRSAIVENVGLVKDVQADSSTIFYAAPDSSSDVDLRVFAIVEDHAIAARPQWIFDGHEPPDIASSFRERRPPANPIADEWWISHGRQMFADWSVATAGYPFHLGTAEVTPLVLGDGRARGVFWVGVDASVTPPAVAVMRVAADAGPIFDERKSRVPASASRIVVEKDVAHFTIEPHYDHDDENNGALPAGEGMPCHVDGTVTWEKGVFHLLLRDVPCAPGEQRTAVSIDPYGQLAAIPLTPAKDEE